MIEIGRAQAALEGWDSTGGRIGRSFEMRDEETRRLPTFETKSTETRGNELEISTIAAIRGVFRKDRRACEPVRVRTPFGSC